MPLCIMLGSCRKDFLEVKPNQALVVPTTLQDMQALLDNVTVMNFGSGLHGIAADDYTITPQYLRLFTLPAERNTYRWAADVFEGGNAQEWNRNYQQVFYANVVLDGIAEMERKGGDAKEFAALKGSALFYRAFAFFELLQLFAQPYDQLRSHELPGVPMKLSSDVNERPGRGNQQEAYRLVLDDLQQAFGLLPDRQSVPTRPGRLAVMALRARILNVMGNHAEASRAAGFCISLSPALMDFNTLVASRPRPIASGNVEVLHYRFMAEYSFATTHALSLNVDPYLAGSYAEDDLRKVVFLRDRGNGVVNFKGTYTNTGTLFGGLATDEMYLVRAEASAWEGNVAGAMEDLNALLRSRYRAGKFVPFVASDKKEALRMILMERRKELVTRGLRWFDLRRLNQHPELQQVLERQFDGQVLRLLPGDPRYTFPIPFNELQGSGIAQNPR